MAKKISILLIVSYFLLVAAWPAAARIVPECTSGGVAGACGLCDFFLLIKNIFNFIALTLTPPVAGFMFLVAGLYFLTSGGSEERVSQARKIFVAALIGVLIIYSSWLIVNSIIQVVGKSVDGFNPQSWWQFTCQ